MSATWQPGDTEPGIGSPSLTFGPAPLPLAIGLALLPFGFPRFEPLPDPSLLFAVLPDLPPPDAPPIIGWSPDPAGFPPEGMPGGWPAPDAPWVAPAAPTPLTLEAFLEALGLPPLPEPPAPPTELPPEAPANRPPNLPPVLELAVPAGWEGVFQMLAIDPDGDRLGWRIVGGADAASFLLDPAGGVLSFRTAPDPARPGDADGDNLYQIALEARDGWGAAAQQMLLIRVTDAETPPPRPEDWGEEPGGTPFPGPAFDPSGFSARDLVMI